MGLSSSKHNLPDVKSTPSSSGAVARRNRPARSRLLKYSCLRFYRSDNDETQVPECPGEENGGINSCRIERKSGSDDISSGCYVPSKAEQTDHTSCITSDTELEDWGESSFSDSVPGEQNSSQALSSGSLDPLSQVYSRFSCYPGNLSFRLNRARSLGSSNACLATSSTKNSSDEEQQTVPSVGVVNRHTRPQGCDFFPFRIQHGNLVSNDNSNFGPTSTECSNSLQDNLERDTRHEVVIGRDNDERIESTLNIFSPANTNNTDDAGISRSSRRIAARERVERNVRFSRTLSVGRLRERVLRRSLVPELDLNHFPLDGEFRSASRATRREGSGGAGAQGDELSNGNDFSRPVSSGNALSHRPIPFYNSLNQELETPRSRLTQYRDLMEHQSNFFERRRRIRSQVRVLQRLGNRLGNISGHERSCILSGQHLAGNCTCRISARDVNSSDDANARASISRIGMLAEALFEVLDEIHQQSVALSTRHYASSVASIPAPNEVVESLPVKIFSKLKKKPTDEIPQCYICLVEYEEGDCTRILPCHHEFHRVCVDKWLKEIHRVCPLCRGDM